MVFVFYDTETSSRDLLGQILSYAFIVTDETLTPIEECCGTIRLSRTQLPDIEAILVNKINITELQIHGDPEYLAAKRIHNFLSEQIENYGKATLIGFNSNSFDLSFLRNLLIFHGLNPYFEGKLSNLDVLHMAKALAFQNPDTFPWILSENEDGNPYYAFKLEFLAKAFGVLQNTQSHDAKEDVELTINLVKAFQEKFNFSLAAFKPVTGLSSDLYQGTSKIGKIKELEYSTTNGTPKKYIYRYVVPVFLNPKNALFIYLDTYQTLGENEPVLSCLKYVNANKHFFQIEPLNVDEEALWEFTAQTAGEDPRLANLHSLTDYFELTKKDWDIAYQIHEMGFERIDTLRLYLENVWKKPEDYTRLLQELLAIKQRSKLKKDHYLIQLFNRTCLNSHPNPDMTLLSRYVQARYVTKTLPRTPESVLSLDEYGQVLQEKLSVETDTNTRHLLEQIEHYFVEWLSTLPDGLSGE